MSTNTVFQSVLSEGMEKYLTHKRAVGRRFHTEENVLHILDRFLVQKEIRGVEQITPELLDTFLLSRPRLHFMSWRWIKARPIPTSSPRTIARLVPSSRFRKMPASPQI